MPRFPEDRCGRGFLSPSQHLAFDTNPGCSGHVAEHASLGFVDETIAAASIEPLDDRLVFVPGLRFHERPNLIRERHRPKKGRCLGVRHGSNIAFPRTFVNLFLLFLVGPGNLGGSQKILDGEHEPCRSTREAHAQEVQKHPGRRIGPEHATCAKEEDEEESHHLDQNEPASEVAVCCEG